MEKICCATCPAFEERTKFCRANPPQPLIQINDGRDFVVSKYPVVVYPDTDWCTKHPLFKMGQNKD